MFRKLFLAVPIVVFAVGGSTACATKKFVRTSVGEVNDKVDSLGRSLEETQERTRKNEAKISDVDKAAQARETAKALGKGPSGIPGVARVVAVASGKHGLNVEIYASGPLALELWASVDEPAQQGLEIGNRSRQE